MIIHYVNFTMFYLGKYVTCIIVKIWCYLSCNLMNMITRYLNGNIKKNHPVHFRTVILPWLGNHPNRLTYRSKFNGPKVKYRFNGTSVLIPSNSSGFGETNEDSNNALIKSPKSWRFVDSDRKTEPRWRRWIFICALKS